MVVFAYCRVSTVEQSSMLQEEAILKAYPEAVVQHEKKSGTSKAGRDVLDSLLNGLETGDRLVVWKLDRLARNMSDLLEIVDFIESQGASLEILDQRIDTSTAAGRAFLQMLGVFAEFEINIRRERQAAGIGKAIKGTIIKAYQSTRSVACRLYRLFVSVLTQTRPAQILHKTVLLFAFQDKSESPQR